MTRTLTAAIVALSIAFTGGSAAPAKAASQEDIAAILFGATALFIIGKAIEDNKKRSKKKSSGSKVTRQYHDNRHRYDDRHRPRADRHARSKLLPAECFRRARTDAGVRKYFGGRCLRRNYSRFDRLPDSCRRVYFTEDGRRRGFSAQCLRQRGYAMAR